MLGFSISPLTFCNLSTAIYYSTFTIIQGKRMIGEDGNETVNDMFHENRLLQSELEALRSRVKGMQDVIDSLTARNTELLAERDVAAWAKSTGLVCLFDWFSLLFLQNPELYFS